MSTVMSNLAAHPRGQVPSVTFMSLPDLVLHRIVHYVLDASETEEFYNSESGSVQYAWNLSIFRVNKALYAHAKAVWELNHFVLVSVNDTAFFYQFQQYEIPIAAPYSMSYIVEDREHKLKCHLHVDLDIDHTHLSELETNNYDDRRFADFMVAENEALDRAEAVENPVEEIDILSCKVCFVLCHYDLPDFVRALREIEMAYTCRPGFDFDMQTLSSGIPLPLRVQHLLLDPFRIFRPHPISCDISGYVDPGLATALFTQMTSIVWWDGGPEERMSIEAATEPTDVYHLTSRAFEGINHEFMLGNVSRAAALLNETVDHWQSLRQTLPSMFNDKSEQTMVESFLYALSANQARLNLEMTLRMPMPVVPKITRRDPADEVGRNHGRFGDWREFMWTIEEFANGKDSIAEQGFGILAGIYSNHEHIQAYNICRRWLRRQEDLGRTETVPTHPPEMAADGWQEDLERRSRQGFVQKLVALLPYNLCKPNFECIFDVDDSVEGYELA